MKNKGKIFTLIATICLTLTLFSVTVFATDGTSVNSEMSYEITEESIFDEIYAAVIKNADKILSALAFCGTLVVGLAYKKGLVPLLGKAMGAISRSVDGIKEDGLRSAQSTEERLADIDTAVKEMRDSSIVTGEAISDIEAHLARYENAMTQYSAMKTVMSAQTDMLYAVFMASGLPQYQKEEIGERIAEMRKELQLNESDGKKV